MITGWAGVPVAGPGNLPDPDHNSRGRLPRLLGSGSTPVGCLGPAAGDFAAGILAGLAVAGAAAAAVQAGGSAGAGRLAAGTAGGCNLCWPRG